MFLDLNTVLLQQFHYGSRHFFPNLLHISILNVKLRERWTYWETRNTFSILAGNPKGKRPHGRSMHGCENNINIGLKYSMNVWTGFIWVVIGTSGGLLWILQWTFGFHKGLSNWIFRMFWRGTLLHGVYYYFLKHQQGEVYWTVSKCGIQLSNISIFFFRSIVLKLWYVSVWTCKNLGLLWRSW